MTTLGPYGFSGGLNTKQSPFVSQDNQYYQGRNIELSDGKLKRRDFYKLYSTNTFDSAAPAMGLAYFNSYVVVMHGHGVAYGNGTTWTDITGTTGFYAQNVVATSSILNNMLVMVGESSNPIKWTGTGNCVTLGGSPPSGMGLCAVANNYMFLGGGSANYRIRWSAVGDPETWPSNNYVDVGIGDGTSVKALIPVGQDLLIFKDNSIYKLYTTGDPSSGIPIGPLVNITKSVGCAGGNCVDQLPDGRIVFMGSDTHAYIYDGSSIVDISNPPSPGSNIQSLLDTVTFGKQGFEVASVRVNKNKNQVIFLDRYPTPGLMYIYDYKYNCWSSLNDVHPSYSANSLLNFYDSSTRKFRMLLGSYTYVFELDVATETPTDKSYWQKNIPLSIDGKGYQPRSLLIPLNVGANFTGTLSYGYNSTTYPKSTSFNLSGSAGDVRYTPLVTRPSNNISSLTVRMETNESSDIYYVSPITLSDKIIV